MEPLKEKQYNKGLSQLAEEGVVQILSKYTNPNTKVLGVVGQLQLEVLQARLEYEYGAICTYDPLDYSIARWLSASDPKLLNAFVNEQQRGILLDARGRYILMFESDWSLNRLIGKNPGITFHISSETLVD